MICYKCLKKLPLTEGKHGLHRECFQSWFKVSVKTDFQHLSLKSDQEEIQMGVEKAPLNAIANSFFQGKFKKYSATLGRKDYILKVKQPEYPELPATEYLCNQIATSLKMRVPKYYFIRLQNEMDTFVVENFMHNKGIANLIHIYHFLKNPEDSTCENILHIIKEKTGKKEDISRFIEMCLFDALIGNHDRHGRNFGLIQTTNGFELAPIYDNPSYLAIEEDWLLTAQHEPKGKIVTRETHNPTMSDYVEEFIRLGFKEHITKFKESINLEQLSFLISQSFISNKRKEALQKLILKRYQEISDGT